MEYSDTLHDAQVIIPHANWRGSYDRGTTQGSCFVYGANGQAVIPPPDSTPSGGDRIRPVGGTWGGSAEHCINVDWPAAYTWSARQYRRGYNGPVSWMGSLIYESRDASGLYYRRNRYYDSEAGRFTQEDPIGLAGGVNAYGFASGDPVSYSDPYGLCKKPKAQKDGEIGICIESFIAAKLAGAGNGRGPNGNGGGFKTSIRFTMNPRTGRLTSRPEYGIGKTMGLIPGTGALGIGVPQSDGNGGWTVAVGGSARQVEILILGNINFNINLHVSANGRVTTAGGTHDGYPSYEVWAYPAGGGANLVYYYREGQIGQLYGRGDVTVPDRRP